jgi:SAM-dependent methyltransferase
MHGSLSSQPAPVARDRAYAASTGYQIYTPLALAVYDWYVLGFSNRFVWRCPTRHLLADYDQHISARHLDIGVGTGYFLDHCRFPTLQPSLTLLDLNANALRWTARRLRRYQARTYQADVLMPIEMRGDQFDSIGMSLLLHCVPGDFSTKSAVFGHIRPLLKKGGVVFGSTVLGTGVPHNSLARRLLATYNKTGLFSNTTDSAADLERALRLYFDEIHMRVEGCVALFSARRTAASDVSPSLD